ncbi:hypothetical protein PTKIN_Ptkin16aG0103200 [Pterospermum kingtungense]
MDPNFGEKNTPISSSLEQQQHYNPEEFTSWGEMNPLTSSSLEQQHYNPEEFTNLGDLDAQTSSLLGQEHYNPDEYINWGELSSLLGQQHYNPDEHINSREVISLTSSSLGQQQNPTGSSNVPGGQLLQYTNSAMVESGTTGHKTEQDSGSGLDLPLPNVLETDTPTAGPNLVKSKAAIYSKTHRDNRKKCTEDMKIKLEMLYKENEEVTRNFSVQALEGIKIEMERLRKENEDIKVEINRNLKEKEEVMRNFSVQALDDIKVKMERHRKEKEDMKVEMERLRKENQELRLSVQKCNKEMEVKLARLRKDFGVQGRKGFGMEGVKVGMKRLREEKEDVRRRFFPLLGISSVKRQKRTALALISLGGQQVWQ